MFTPQPLSDFFTGDLDTPLRRPVLLMALEGWNDAGEAASSALDFLLKEKESDFLGTIAGEDFYDYAETRPIVTYVDGESQGLVWPAIGVHKFSTKDSDRDFLIILGAEPQLRWPTFIASLIVLIDVLKVEEVVLLGALLADVPHTRPPKIFSAASTVELRARVRALGTILTDYDGPTGIIGVLQDICGRHGVPTVSLWGNVPHYITATPNTHVCVALLQRISALESLNLNLKSLRGQARTFQTRVDEAIAHSPDAMRYVQELEAKDETGASPDRSPLPTGPEVVHALEEFLRQRQKQETDDDVPDN